MKRQITFEFFQKKYVLARYSFDNQLVYFNGKGWLAFGDSFGATPVEFKTRSLARKKARKLGGAIIREIL